MSREYPIIAVTGSSGAGTTTVRRSFERMFLREDVHAAMVDGDAFHRYTRDDLKRIFREEPERKDELSHFAVEANLLDRLEGLFIEYGEHGAGITISMRKISRKLKPGIGWAPSPSGSRCLAALTCCFTKGCTVG